MATQGKSQLLMTFVATPDKVAEIDRLVASHAGWMAETHHRGGEQGAAQLQLFEGARALESARSGFGAHRQHPLCVGWDLRVAGRHCRPLAAGTSVMGRLRSAGRSDRRQQPTVIARGGDRRRSWLSGAAWRVCVDCTVQPWS